MRVQRLRSWKFALLTGLAGVIFLAGCASMAPEEKPGDPMELQKASEAFQTNMRWAKYEDAAELVHEAYRSRFEGEYEERGEDYKITSLGTKKVEVADDGFSAVIEVEQEWYQLPSTTVETERFVERWIWEDDRWQMRERLRRDDYRDRDEVFDSEEQEASDAEEQATQ